MQIQAPTRNTAVFLMIVSLFVNPFVFAATDDEMVQEVREEVKERIRSYIRHLERRIEDMEERRAGRDDQILRNKLDIKRKAEAREAYLKGLPPSEIKEARVDKLRKEFLEAKRLEALLKEQLRERYAKRQRLLDDARERYDILEAAQEYDLD